MVGFIDPRVRIEVRVDHDAIDEIVDDRGNAVDAAESFVKGCLWLLGRHGLLLVELIPFERQWLEGASIARRLEARPRRLTLS